MSASSRSARSRSPTASSASTSSQVSAPVTHGLVETQRMPRPGTTKVSQRSSTSARRSEEHTSELQSRRDLVCRLLLEKKKKKTKQKHTKQKETNEPYS